MLGDLERTKSIMKMLVVSWLHSPQDQTVPEESFEIDPGLNAVTTLAHAAYKDDSHPHPIITAVPWITKPTPYSCLG